jgi:uncharacterized membrane protein YbhN (UPF0104 family)
MMCDISWRRIAQIVLVAAAIIYLAQRILLDRSKLAQFDWQLRPGPLTVSLVLLLAAFAGYPLAWRFILRKMGADLPAKKSFRIWYISNLARYVPGKVWQIVGRVEFAKNLGVARRTSAASVVYETGMIITSGLVIGVAIAEAEGRRFSSVALILVIPLVVLLLAFPRLVLPLLNKVLRRTGRAEISFELSPGWAAAIFLFYAILWVVQGAGYFFLVRSVAVVPVRLLPQFVGIYAAAWIAGFVSFVSPGGLGVREGVMAFLLGFYLPPSVSAVIAIVSRIWVTIGEVICAGVTLKA